MLINSTVPMIINHNSFDSLIPMTLVDIWGNMFIWNLFSCLGVKNASSKFLKVFLKNTFKLHLTLNDLI